jgi:fatty-acid peroxygenase
MRQIPRDKAFDNSLAFLKEGYSFVSSRCDRLNSDIFRTRIMLNPVICMRGAEAAALFYEGDRFTRIGAMPTTVLHLLQDVGSVQSLDGAAHRNRKQMFMSMMSTHGIDRIAEIFAEEWRRAVPRWRERSPIVLQDEAGDVLTRTAMRWAGLSVEGDEVRQRRRELMAMIENAGSFGPSHLWARLLRRRSERWAARMMRGVRNGRIKAASGTPIAILADHRDSAGQRLTDDIAAVELLNLLRPIVAIGRFIVFAALALYQHPGWRHRIAGGDMVMLEPFVQEVRRYYPFFPVIGGRVRDEFVWQDYAFRRGAWVLLDLYGTNHDKRLWPEPEAFKPERFEGWQGDPNTLVPQGGGTFETGHRCPGEWITIAIMKEAVRLLSCEMSYEVPAQDLTVRLDRMPALPEEGFIIAEPKAAGAVCLHRST